MGVVCMFAKSIVKEEILRLRQLLKRLKEELRNLPRGSISEKDRNGVKYYYWARRENERIVFKYIGKAGSEPVIKAKEQRIKQLNLRERIKKIQNDINELEKLLG
jgi:L-lactate utilization protein LutB